MTDLPDYPRTTGHLRSMKATAGNPSSVIRAADYLEGLLEGFVAYDQDWRMTYMNAAAERVLGQKREDVLGKSWREAFPHLTGNAVDRMYERVMRTRVGERLEVRDEHYGKWFEISSSPVRDGGIAVYFRDISDRMLAVEALQEETRALEKLDEIGRMLAAELDLERVVQSVTDVATEVSKAAFGSFFYNVMNDKGESYMLYTLSGVPREAFANFPMPRNTAVFAPTFAGAGVVRSDDITRDARYGKSAPHHGMPKGHLPVRSYLAVPVVSRSGEVLGGLFFGHPEAGVFTERAERLVSGIATRAAIAIDNARQLEQLKRAQESLQEVDRRKDEFLAVLGHELRNPLAPIRNAMAVLAKRMPEDADLDWSRSVIERQVLHLCRLVDDLLEIQRISHGKLHMHKERITLSQVLDAALEASGPLIDAANHRFTIAVPPREVVLEVDPVRIAQALSNLLNNAAKYTPDGGSIHLAARIEGGEVSISVKDSGIGFEGAVANQLFKPFSQLAGARERSRGGLGIGLSLVQHIVALHGGDVAAHSDGSDRGSVFTIRLPLALVQQARQTAVEPRPVSERSLQILIADDNRDAADSMHRMLEMGAHQVRTVYDGSAALELAGEFAPDVALLDIDMPGVDGYGVARSLRERYGHRVMLVAITGMGKELERLRGREDEFDLHFTKPIDISALNNVLTRAARRAPSA
jgi:PAS domain S-box-containing protein